MAGIQHDGFCRYEKFSVKCIIIEQILLKFTKLFFRKFWARTTEFKSSNKIWYEYNFYLEFRPI